MRYIAAYMLALLGGNTSPSADDLKKILSSVGIDAADENINKVISELKGKDIDEVIAAGTSVFAPEVDLCVSEDQTGCAS